ncbi:hypothetical protein CA13_28190 [Planctomycetes bacterium CA13]|uniref:DUF4440 domain-containing protein n=1 Tax=Novipirellula herctigrandis TaxID=2527986 RepID=A0A5C5Z345_9BACT|nr:hypothetical protein CA13_28190 [Planctomycetes bacterium CA13]
MRVAVTIVSTFMFVACGFAQDNSPPPKLSADQQAIRKNAEAFVAAFDKGDAKAVASFWAKKGEMSLDGEPVAVGREQVAASYADYFKDNEGAKIEVNIESIRVLGPNLAIERGSSEVLNDADDSVIDAYRLIYAKEDGKWLIASADIQQEVIQPPFDWKEELGFLVGKWTTKDGDWSANTEFEWALGGNFLKRTFTIKDGDEEDRTGIQLIGWDASEQLITSWTFGVDGGHGRARWFRDGDQWIVESDGVSPNGEIVLAHNIITPLDDDAFRWQSTGRSIAGVALEDTETVRVSRVK